MRQPILSSLLLTAILAAVTPSPAKADSVLFSRPLTAGDRTASGFITTDFNPLVDDFTLAQNSVITGLRWWGAYTGVPDEASAPAVDDFHFWTFANQAAVLAYDNVFYNAFFPVTRTSTGLHTVGGNLIFEYVAGINLPMAAGTHYLEMVNGAGWGWMGTAGQGSVDGIWRWNRTSWDEVVPGGGLAFEVIGTTPDVVPEPGLMVLLTAGFAGLVARRLHNPVIEHIERPTPD